jgi:transcriptional regulator with XRE-family HTH domain
MARNKPSEEWAGYAREVGLAIQRKRVAAGLTQEHVAYAAGLTRSHYQLLEKGLGSRDRSANPSLLTLVAIAQVLKVEVSELMASGAPDVTTRL